MQSAAAQIVPMQSQVPELPATEAEIGRIIGTVDDSLIARIAATGVTHAELLEVYLLLAGDDHLESAIGEPTGRLAQVIKLLTEEQAWRGRLDV
jgi:hypothetical protein